MSSAGIAETLWDSVLRQAGCRLPVLLYHYVGPRQIERFPKLGISPQEFERQMDWLVSRGYSGICPQEWLRGLADPATLPAKPILITFDDAYEDLDEHAFPVLKRNSFGAGVYVVTAQIGGTNVWDYASGSSSLRLLGRGQIRHWADRGIEFGAHTRNHPDLRTQNAASLVDELRGSREDLEDLLGRTVSSFSYPYGSYNQAVSACVRQHFSLAFTVHGGINYLGTDAHLMRRSMVVQGEGPGDFASRVRFGWTRASILRSALGFEPATSEAA